MKLIIDEKQKQLIENEALAFATCDEDNKPNVITVACCKVIDDNKILVTDNFMNKTRKNLLENQKVALAVWSKDLETGFQFKGIAQYLTTGKWKKMVDEDKDNEGLAHKAAILVTVTEIWDLAKPHLMASR